MLFLPALLAVFVPPLSWVYEGPRRFAARLLVPPRAPVPEALGDLFVETADGHRVPLSEVAAVHEEEGPAQIRREDRVRIVRVEVNLRGRDLLSWVRDAQAAVAAAVELPGGYAIPWSGQFENLVARSELLSQVWATQFDPGSNLVEVHISRLRDKLGEHAAMIDTVRGKGYRLRQGPP